MASQNGRWVLVEFVGGPADGKVMPIRASSIAEVTHGLIGLVNASPRYRPLGMPDDERSLDSWADRERVVIARFESGSPELYMQMVWDEATFTPTDTIDNLQANGDNQTPLVEQFVRALELGQQEQCRFIARRAKADGSTTGLIESVLAPAMISIGNGWSTGTLSVAVEHRATSIVGQLLAEHARPATGPRRGLALVAAVDDEWHGLPTDMAVAALRDDDWYVEQLGAGVPSDALLNGSLLDDVDLVVLSVTMESCSRQSADTANLLRERGTPVLVGGPGLPLGGLQKSARMIINA